MSRKPLLPLIPPPGAGPYFPSSSLYLLPHQLPSPTRKGGKEEGGTWSMAQGSGGQWGAGGLSYLKWLCMILILIYTDIKALFIKKLSPSHSCVHCVCKDCSM